MEDKKTETTQTTDTSGATGAGEQKSEIINPFKNEKVNFLDEEEVAEFIQEQHIEFTKKIGKSMLDNAESNNYIKGMFNMLKGTINTFKLSDRFSLINFFFALAFIMVSGIIQIIENLVTKPLYLQVVGTIVVLAVVTKQVLKYNERKK